MAVRGSQIHLRVREREREREIEQIDLVATILLLLIMYPVSLMYQKTLSMAGGHRAQVYESVCVTIHTLNIVPIISLRQSKLKTKKKVTKKFNHKVYLITLYSCRH